jgi:hypothetical protein
MNQVLFTTITSIVLFLLAFAKNKWYDRHADNSLATTVIFFTAMVVATLAWLMTLFTLPQWKV